jgi:hypothetical protein
MIKNKKNNLWFFSFLLISFSALSFGNNAFAATAKLNWQANTESDLAGYKVYWGTTARTGTSAPGGYANSQDVGNVTEYTINNISNTGTTYFSITAKDASTNESGFSNEVKKKPGNVNKDEDGSGIGIVNGLDIISIINCIGQPVSGTCLNADVNVDNSINSLDIMGVINNFGNTN